MSICIKLVSSVSLAYKHFHTCRDADSDAAVVLVVAFFVPFVYSKHSYRLIRKSGWTQSYNDEQPILDF